MLYPATMAASARIAPHPKSNSEILPSPMKIPYTPQPFEASGVRTAYRLEPRMKKSAAPVPEALRFVREDFSEEDKVHRNLHKMVKLAHAMNAREQELALVLLQTIAAWNGLSEPPETGQP